MFNFWDYIGKWSCFDSIVWKLKLFELCLMQKFLTFSFPGIAENEFSFPFYNVNIFKKNVLYHSWQ